MTIIKNSVLIACTPEQAFDYLVDLRNELEWNPKVESMEKITNGPIGVGTTFSAKWKHSTQLEVKCTEFDRPQHWVYFNGGPVHVTLTARLQPEHEKTRLEVDFDARPNGMFRLIFPFFLLIMRRDERANMTHLRQALEARLA